MMTRMLGWLTLFLIGTDLFVVSPLLPQITGDLRVTPAAGGLAVTAFAFAYLVGGPAFGALADRRGHAGVLAGALLLFAVANLATGFAPDLAALLAARALAGLAASGITPSVYALIGAAAPPGSRASWLATVTSGLLLALTTGAPAGSLLGSAVGWHAVFFVLAAAALAILLVTRRVLGRQRPGPSVPAGLPVPPGLPVLPGPSGPPADHQPGPAPAAGPAPRVLARMRAVGVTGLWALAVYGVYTYLGTIITQDLHAGTGTVAAALVCYGAGALAGNLAGGRLADRIGGRRSSLASLTGLTVALTVLAGVLRAGPGPVLAVLTLLGLLAYPYFSAQQARLAQAFPSAAGTILAWNNSAMYAGILLGSALGGPLLHASGPTVLALAAAVAAALAALTAARRIGPAISPPGEGQPGDGPPDSRRRDNGRRTAAAATTAAGQPPPRQRPPDNGRRATAGRRARPGCGLNRLRGRSRSDRRGGRASPAGPGPRCREEG
jgi:predicted MFS family arabinose efflux permease